MPMFSIILQRIKKVSLLSQNSINSYPKHGSARTLPGVEKYTLSRVFVCGDGFTWESSDLLGCLLWNFLCIPICWFKTRETITVSFNIKVKLFTYIILWNFMEPSSFGKSLLWYDLTYCRLIWLLTTYSNSLVIYRWLTKEPRAAIMGKYDSNLYNPIRHCFIFHPKYGTLFHTS